MSGEDEEFEIPDLQGEFSAPPNVSDGDGEVPPDGNDSIPDSIDTNGVDLPDVVYDEQGNAIDFDSEGVVPPDTPIRVALSKEPLPASRKYGLPEPTQSRLLRCTPEERERRIEMVRGMIRLNYTRGDIKRICAREWSKDRNGNIQYNGSGGTLFQGRCVEPYLAWAAARNNQMTEGSEDEKLARALSYWSHKQQQAELTIGMETDARSMADKVYRQSCITAEKLEQEGQRDKEGLLIAAITERLEILELRKRSALARIAQANNAITMAQKDSRECQMQIDRLNGVHAPIKIARTTKDGDDIVRATDEELRDRLKKLGVALAPVRLPIEQDAKPGSTARNEVKVIEAEYSREMPPIDTGTIQDHPNVSGVVTGFRKREG